VTITEACAVNTLLRFLLGDETKEGRVTTSAVLEAGATLARKANKALSSNSLWKPGLTEDQWRQWWKSKVTP